MTVTCPCGTTNRLPSALKGRARCGKCKHTFTPTELAKAAPEPPKPAPAEFTLEFNPRPDADSFDWTVDPFADEF